MDLENSIPTFILFVDKWSILKSLISVDGLFLTLLYLCKLIQACNYLFMTKKLCAFGVLSVRAICEPINYEYKLSKFQKILCFKVEVVEDYLYIFYLEAHYS